MQPNNLLQEAIAKARAGHELTARELFLDVVRADPQNELAWTWLVGLLDDLDARIEACQQVLRINPANSKIEQHLQKLQAQQAEINEKQHFRFENQVILLQQMAKSDPQRARRAIRELMRGKIENAEAWKLLADLSDDMGERAQALENFIRLSPENGKKPRKQIETLRYYQKNPLALAAEYEDRGDYDKAIEIYRRMMTAYSASDRTWTELYDRIYSAEAKIRENLPFVPPALSILRLMFGPSLLYLVLTMLHTGFKPLSEPALWIGYLWAVWGGFMVALTTVHSPERLQIFMQRFTGLRKFPVALSARLIGSFLILAPYALLLLLAYLRFKASVSGW